MASPYAGAVFVSPFLGIALLIIGIEIIAVGATGRSVYRLSCRQIWLISKSVAIDDAIA
jgi:hypothetical protein